MSGAGFPWGMVSPRTTTAMRLLSPVAFRTWWMSAVIEPDASATGKAAAIRRTASTAPGSTGRCRSYAAIIRRRMSSISSGPDIWSGMSSHITLAHSTVDLPMHARCISSFQVRPCSAASSMRDSFQTGSESTRTPSMSKMTARMGMPSRYLETGARRNLAAGALAHVDLQLDVRGAALRGAAERGDGVLELERAAEERLQVHLARRDEIDGARVDVG